MIETLWLTDVDTSARADRGILTDLYVEGVKSVTANQFRVVPRAAGANMTVTVQRGTSGDAVAYIMGDDFVGQNLYRVLMDADTEDVAIAAAPSSGSRTDTVVLETVDKTAVGGTVNTSRIRVLTGVSALTSANKTMIALATVTVAAGQASVTSANITDKRVASALTVPVAGLLVADTSTRNQLPGASGKVLFNPDVRRPQFHDGSSWRSIGAPVSGVGSMSLTLTQSLQVVAFYVGTGFSEVEFVISNTPNDLSAGINNQLVFRATVTANPDEVAVSAGTNSPAASHMVPLSGGTEVLLNANGSSGRNFRIDADGFVRFEARRGAGTPTAFTYNYAWRAR